MSSFFPKRTKAQYALGEYLTSTSSDPWGTANWVSGRQHAAAIPQQTPVDPMREIPDHVLVMEMIGRGFVVMKADALKDKL